MFEVEHRHLAEKVGENKDAIKCIDGRVKVLEKDVDELKGKKA